MTNDDPDFAVKADRFFEKHYIHPMDPRADLNRDINTDTTTYEPHEIEFFKLMPNLRMLIIEHHGKNTSQESLDQVFDEVSKLKNLDTLDISKGEAPFEVTADNIRKLQAIESLRELGLAEINDQTLEAIAEHLPNLERLVVYGDFTNEGLKNLEKMKNLKNLHIFPEESKELNLDNDLFKNMHLDELYINDKTMAEFQKAQATSEMTVTDDKAVGVKLTPGDKLGHFTVTASRFDEPVYRK